MARGCRKEGDADGQPAQVQIEGLVSDQLRLEELLRDLTGVREHRELVARSGRSVKTARRRLYAFAGFPQAIREDPDGAAAGAD